MSRVLLQAKLTLTKMIFYDVASRRFANPYAAFLYGSNYHPLAFPKFNFFEQEFDKVDWTIEPTETFRELCDQRAFQLRNKYKKITLAFSGGTDSITMYNAFVRNNIHIDEIYVAGQRHGMVLNGDPYNDPHHWLINNHPDKNTKFLFESLHDESVLREFENVIADKDFLLSPDTSSMLRYHPQPLDVHSLEKIITGESCVIGGYEKPRIVKDENGYYFEFVDLTFRTITMRPDIEFFFVTPDMPQLHAKQCHMLLKTSQQLGISIDELEKNRYYYTKCIGCGRDTEISANESLIEKHNLTEFSVIMKSINFVDGVTDQFKELAKNNIFASAMTFGFDQNRQSMKKFIDHWAALQTDNTLVEYLVRHKILDSKHHPIQSYNGLLSKKYKLKDIHV